MVSCPVRGTIAVPGGKGTGVGARLALATPRRRIPGPRLTTDIDPRGLPVCEVGAPGEIRTPDHLVRSQVLYPAELRARTRGGKASPRRPIVSRQGEFGGERGIRTLDGAINPILP